MKKVFNPYIIITFIIISIFVGVALRMKSENNDIRYEGVLVRVKIIDFLGGPPGGDMSISGFLCQFTFEGKKKELRSTVKARNNGFSYIGKTYPALYSKKYDVLRLLMNPEDYEKYGLKYPDSLLYK